MARDFNDDDEGKDVVTADGDPVGTIESVMGDRAMVKPDANLNRSVRRRLTWSDEGEETYQLRKSSIDRIDDKVHLKDNF